MFINKTFCIAKSLLSLILLIALLTSCANSNAQKAGNNIDLGRTPEEREAAAVDMDLSILSTTVLSAELFNIFANADDNAGKMIRVRGLYANAFFSESGEYNHYIITLDGDECCREGFRFVWRGDHVFPDDYPQIDARIELDGVFTIREIDGVKSFYLATDDIFILR